MTWKAYIQINTEDTSNYSIEEFEITNEEYRALTEAVANNVPIVDLDIYDDIYKKAENAADCEWVVDKWAGVDDEDECCVVDVIVNDPGDLTRFKSAFIGRPLAEDASFEIEEDDERIIYYTVNVETEDGVIKDLDIDVMAIEMLGFRYNYESDDAYPDYKLLEESLNELIEDYRHQN